MPQMKPINWLLLFLLLNLLLMMMNIMNFYYKNMKINKFKLSMKNKKNIWTW